MSHFGGLTFLLGADDPEMRRIEAVLHLLGCSYAYATVNGVRANPGNAYRADTVDSAYWKPRPGLRKLVCVECGIPGVTPYKIIDHHREGDPGYELGAKEFWKASSLGQLFSLLDLCASTEDLYIAAMDHCFSAAVHGCCPEIDPKEVIRLKRASLEEVRAAEDAQFVERIMLSVTDRIAGQEVWIFDEDLGDGYSHSYLKAIQVATELGMPIILRSRNAAGERERFHLCGGNVRPSTARVFMDTWAPKRGLVDIYGVPERGYAGGYAQITNG
ncbi:MAG: hypothetical protein KC877_02015 [Candidatus Kaiserbacteria bacterium]|nr:hypothetical protein [Candidatus Kaiserbacteria bacterium]MCB9816189.1 hypothetical protein [Candidatus Nomurabacteria bacterium]